MRAPSRFELFQQAHEIVRAAAAAAGPEDRERLEQVRAFVWQVAKEDQERERQAIVFRRAGGELWEVGDEGATQVIAATSVGVATAHRALLRERPPADKAIAHAVRVTAAAWARHAGCPRLAEVLPRIAVRAGHLEFLPGPRPPRLVLR